MFVHRRSLTNFSHFIFFIVHLNSQVGCNCFLCYYLEKVLNLKKNGCQGSFHERTGGVCTVLTFKVGRKKLTL